jgi:hypothetical protein
MPCSSGPSDWEEDRNFLSYRQSINRLTRVACELAKLLKQDARLFSKISPRTKRWIKKHDQIDREREEARDKEIRLAKRRKVALAKLTRKEKELLNLPVDDPTDD